MSGPRQFDYVEAALSTLPLLLGVAGPTGSGKTFSALRLATGMQQVTGGDIGLVDTEAKRGTAYSKYFKFKHLDFAPPFGPIDYIDAIATCIKRGAKNIIIDSMTHEHSGPGGVMDQIDRWLDEKCGDNYAEREKKNFLAHKAPKAQRKQLNNYIIQAGRDGINFIFCYRADEKVKPVQGQGVVKMGMTPETTSKLVYEMMAMFLLTAASDGRPNLAPATPQEKMLTKLPLQFRELLAAGEPLSENLGRQLAEWARGTPPPPPPAAPQPTPLTDLPENWEALDLVARGENRAAKGSAHLRAWWESLTAADRKTHGGKLPTWKATAEAVTA